MEMQRLMGKFKSVRKIGYGHDDFAAFMQYSLIQEIHHFVDLAVVIIQILYNNQMGNCSN